jgi:hypothetical protein
MSYVAGHLKEPWSAASLPPSPSLRRDKCEAVVSKDNRAGWSLIYQRF